MYYRSIGSGYPLCNRVTFGRLQQLRLAIDDKSRSGLKLQPSHLYMWE